MHTTIPSKRRTIRSTTALLASVAAFTFGSAAMTGHADAMVDEPNHAPVTSATLLTESQPTDSVLREHQIQAQLDGQHTSGPQIH